LDLAGNEQVLGKIADIYTLKYLVFLAAISIAAFLCLNQIMAEHFSAK